MFREIPLLENMWIFTGKPLCQIQFKRNSVKKLN